MASNTSPEPTPESAPQLSPELLRFIKWADKTPAVTWAGTGGLKDRLENPQKFPKAHPFTSV